MMENKLKRNESLILDENQAEILALSSSPVSFLVVGKPGNGKTTLAELIASTWKCIHINDTLSLEEATKVESELGNQAREILCSGESVKDEIILELLAEKLKSPSVQHYGYVMDCLPTVSHIKANIEEQLNFIKEMKPTIIIHLKISDQDLARRRDDHRVDMSAGGVRVSSLSQTFTDSSNEDLPQSSENSEDGEEEKINKEDIYEEELKDLSIPEVTMNPEEPWAKKTQDFTENVQRELDVYNNNVLVPLEDFIMSHNRQNLIELNANLSPKELFKSVLMALDNQGLCRSPVPKRLFVSEDDVDVGTDGLDNEEFLRQLCETSNILPKFRWRRSKWGRYCPVKLVEGNLIHGKMEFSVGFLDKMYCLSSMDALEKFVLNPRPYLLPPLPIIPCKVCVVGPPTSGRTTLAKAIADHFNAMVLNIEDLIAPFVSHARNKVVELATEEAETSVMNQLAVDQTKSSDQTEITKKHPKVVKAVEEAVKVAVGAFAATEEMYVDAIKGGIAIAEERKAKQTGVKPAFGGWVIDGFPKTRDYWAALVENDILPDSLIILDDHEAPENYLFSRFTNSHTISNNDSTKTEGELAAEVSDLLTKWQKTKAEHDQHMEQLIATAKGSAIDPQIINCAHSKEKITSEAISFLEGIFCIKPYEYTFADEDADADDDPLLESDVNEEEGDIGDDEESSRKIKPWGDTKHYCPVALKELDVLWPGSDDYCLKYKERLYCFSNEEAKEKFLNNPEAYVATAHLLKPPPMRVFLLGPKNTGKTSIGRKIAAKYNLFHISFKEYLQERILSKVAKPPLVDDDEWEGEVPPEDEDESSEIKEDLTDDEVEIRGYLVNGEPPSDELFKKFTEQFWFNEPYKSSGFVLEGFPMKPEEMHILAGCGLYPDAIVIFEVEEEMVIKRTLPRRLSIWKKKRNERLLKRKQHRDKIITEWEKDKEQRKTDVKAEYSERIAAVTRKSPVDEEDEEEDEVEQLEEEQQERLAEIDEEEPPEIEEEEEEEDESEAMDRMKSALSEQYQECVELISQIQEVCTELRIPTHAVNATKKEPVVEFSASKLLLPYSDNRQGLFLKSTPVDPKMAKILLDKGYKLLSKFRKWCSVEMQRSKYNVLPPMLWKESNLFPVIFRQHLYYLSSAANRELFMANPLKFLQQAVPKPPYPVSLAIVGPPKSGKTIVANRFCQEYGCVRLSMGEVLRRQISSFPKSTLAEIILSHLKAGKVVPDDICALALESALLDIQCATRGYVLDGWPLTKAQTDKLSDCHIIPVCILELDANTKEILRRAKKDREYSERFEPIHDSDLIITERSKQYYESIALVKQWYTKQHDNWHNIDGNHSIWWVWEQCKDRVLYITKQIQQYIFYTPLGRVASIHGLCVTPTEFEAAVGSFSTYCPVDFALHGELVDCKNESLQYAAEYRQKYYKMCSEEDLKLFLDNPGSFVTPEFPTNLPKRKSQSQVKALFPKRFEINGFCSVCYLEWGKSYESLKPGNSDYVAEYDAKLYCFCTPKHLDVFMRKPHKFASLNLPAKLPPLRDPTSLDTLPILGFLEQTIASAVTEALSAVGSFKPKYPFSSSTNSALHFVALHLKAFNKKSNTFVRQTYKKELQDFEEKCELIEYLSSEMNYGYQEPQERHISFDRNMNTFENLKSNIMV